MAPMAGFNSGSGSGMGSPAMSGTPRASFAATYLGGSDRRGSRPASSAFATSTTILSRRRWRSSAGVRSGRAAAMADQRGSAISNRFWPEIASIGTNGMARPCSIPTTLLL